MHRDLAKFRNTQHQKRVYKVVVAIISHGFMSTLRELVINCQKSRDFDSEPIGSIASVLPWESSTEKWKLMKMKELCARGLEGKCPASHVFCRGNLKTRCELYERSRYGNGHLKIVEKL